MDAHGALAMIDALDTDGAPVDEDDDLSASDLNLSDIDGLSSSAEELLDEAILDAEPNGHGHSSSSNNVDPDRGARVSRRKRMTRTCR